MGKDSKTITAKHLIDNILSNNIDNVDSIIDFIDNTKSVEDLVAIIFAVDISNISSTSLKIKMTQYKTVLLEQLINNDVAIDNNSIEIKSKKPENLKQRSAECLWVDDDDYDESLYNKPGSPIIEYGEESEDGFIYIDGRHQMIYEPLTEEKAKKFVFLEKKLLPPKGSVGQINQKFQYEAEDGLRACDRRFIINGDGHVVRFLGEYTKAINADNKLLNDGDYLSGSLADLLKIEE